MTVGPALVKARNEALNRSGRNVPKGKKYNQFMSELLETYNVLPGRKHEITRHCLFLIMANLADVEKWRSEQRNPIDLNHPTTVWFGYKKYRSKQQAKDNPLPENDDTATLKVLDKKYFSADELVMDEGALANAHNRIAELEASPSTARAESIDRSIAASQRLPDPPVFSLDNEVLIETAVMTFIVTYGKENSRQFALKLIAMLNGAPEPR